MEILNSTFSAAVSAGRNFLARSSVAAPECICRGTQLARERATEKLPPTTIVDTHFKYILRTHKAQKMRITTFGIVFLIIFVATGALTSLLRKWENTTEAIGANGTCILQDHCMESSACNFASVLQYGSLYHSHLVCTPPCL